jgi:hypothetical protein
MRKLIVASIIILALSFPTFADQQSDDLSHLFAGSFVAEHLKRKGCSPFDIFVITGGLSLVKELWDKDFSERDMVFSIGGVLFTYSVDEIGKFILDGISLLTQNERTIE